MVFIEKEVKVLDIDLAKTIASLEWLWATKNYDTILYDKYFDTHEDHWAQLRKNVRIRFTAQWDVLTLKQRLPNKDYKAAYEDEWSIDWEKAQEVLHTSGFVAKRAKYKRRISYTYQDMIFDIDLYPTIPPLLEIEAQSLQTIRKGITLLWLEEKQIATCGARGLFKRYNRQVEKVL